MATQEFAIYQGPTGPTAVTNPIQQQILAALADGDKQLPELVAITGRSKPTLSGIHMKELLNRELIVERAHPSDNRRKVYRLNARALGSSQVPVDQLRNAVQSYARATGTGGLSAGRALLVLGAAPPKAGEATLRAQARALGAHFASQIHGDSPRAFAVALSQFVEQEGLAQHLQLDFERLSFRCRPGPALSGLVPGRVGLLLAGFAEGAADAQGLADVRFRWESQDETFRIVPAEPRAGSIGSE